MPKPDENDEERDNRIEMEIVVDAYNKDERAMGWYYYLEDHLNFPFSARCIQVRPASPLEKGDLVNVTGMAPETECRSEIFVEMRWEKRRLAVPLSQLEVLDEDEKSREAVEDWHYWVRQRYEF